MSDWRCTHVVCPLTASGADRCLAEVTRHRPYCDWAVSSHPKRREFVAVRSREGSEQADARSYLPYPPPSPVSDLSDAQVETIRSCPHRTVIEAGCCTTDACDVPGRNRGGRWMTADCVACILAGLAR